MSKKPIEIDVSLVAAFALGGLYSLYSEGYLFGDKTPKGIESPAAIEQLVEPETPSNP